MVVSNIFYFHPYLGKIPILTNILQRGWNHQLVIIQPWKQPWRWALVPGRWFWISWHILVSPAPLISTLGAKFLGSCSPFRSISREGGLFWKFIGNPWLAGGNSIIFYFRPDPWGNDPIWRAYFSNGLVQPPSRWLLGEIQKNTHQIYGIFGWEAFLIPKTHWVGTRWAPYQL